MIEEQEGRRRDGHEIDGGGIQLFMIFGQSTISFGTGPFTN
jgi:hypothetical protein